jgi:hypothetical protein
VQSFYYRSGARSRVATATDVPGSRRSLGNWCANLAARVDWTIFVVSGKAMARTGLRMMPTFPLPPLKFRTYSAPSAPLAGTSRLHRLAAYTGCLRCSYSHMPRRPGTGSELSLMLLRNMSSSETTGNFSAAHTQCFTENAGLQLQR